MQQPRHDTDGVWLCQADNCDEPGTLVWTRRDAAGNDVPVTGCTTHQLDPETAALIHQPSCEAPPACMCKPVALPARVD